jgi:hypothetical protein
MAYVQTATLMVYFDQSLDRYSCTFMVAAAWPDGVLKFFDLKVLRWSCTCVAKHLIKESHEDGQPSKMP